MATNEDPTADTTAAAATSISQDDVQAKKKKAEEEKLLHDELYSLKVKPEFVLTGRSSALPPLPVATDDASSAAAEGSAAGGGGSNEGGEGTSSDDRNNRKKNKKKKNRGMNRKRPRDARTAECDKMCLALIRGEECPYGAERCRYSHDVKAALADRPPDIVEVEGGCPRYNLAGYCGFGILCRVGGGHVDMATGKNLRRDDGSSQEEKKGGEEQGDVVNVLDKKIQAQLRKKKYPFVCKRFNEREGGGGKGRQQQQQKKNEEGGNGPKGGGGGGEKGGQAAAAVAVGQSEEEESKQEAGAATVKSEDEPKGKDDEDDSSPAAKEHPTSPPAAGGGGACGAPPTAPSAESAAPPPPSDKGTTVAGAVAAAVAAAPDLSPLPTKTRKLIDFRNKVYVAPLTTVGNLPYRRIMKKFGADITCGEMAVATNLLEGKASEWALLKRHRTEDVFGVQIAAGFPDQFTRICEVLDKHVEMDFVDLNLGCPIDLICRKGSGASLMLRDKKLRQCLEGISGALSDCPFTIKMRTGWDEGNPVAHLLVPKIQSWRIEGLSTIMIHGRSRLQRYQKLADWDYIVKTANSQVSDLPAIPVIGNGDVFSYKDYEEKVAREGIEATAMLGRGALIKPWLPTEIKERRNWDISATERLDMLKEFVRNGLEHWGSDQQGVNNTRRFLLEWLSFLYRYVPVGMLERVPQEMNQRPPNHMCGRSDLETLMLSRHCTDWIKISEMLLGPVPPDFRFEPKHKANSYSTR